ncbi:Aste57867_8311 [Aphanomyces stellatus]|uniref:Aste57867_8311 protein n=1 Tax=Aphanomyces stellatus TaxID=120398 RepID=A0A485KJY9_9STRA|nr:hypothetical protein As57867_008279 [Aphanomyces stellatus]VFT85198.1 Aste57867_8311 [Aphanomyces stellatus]
MNFTAITTSPTLPGPITNVHENSATGGFLQFNITPPIDSGGCPLTNYTMYVYDISSNQFMVIGSSDLKIPSLYTVYLPYSNTRYIFQVEVRTQNIVGWSNRTSNFTFSTTAATLPGPPRSILSQEQTGGAVALRWLPPLDSGGVNIIGYKVYFRKTGDPSPFMLYRIATTNSVIVGPLYQKTAYDFIIVAINQLGVQMLPGLAINTSSYSIIEMENALWIPSALQAASKEIALLTTYYGSSIQSSQMFALGNTSEIATFVTTAVTLPSSPPVPLQMNYSSGSLLKLHALSPIDTGGAPVTGFRVFVQGIEVFEFFTLENIAQTDLLLESVVLIPGFAPSTWYNVSVMAINVKSVCEASSAGNMSPYGQFKTNVPSVPAPMASLTDAESTGGGMSLVWSAPFDRGVSMNDTLYYALYMSKINTNSWILLKNDTQTTYWVMGLDSETSYNFGVDVASSVGSAGIENMIVMTFKTSGISVPGPPAPPTFMNHTGGSITFNWNPPLDNGGEIVTSYIVEVQGFDQTQETANTWLTYAGLLAATSYNVRVSAVNIMGVGSPSMYAQFSTDIPSPAQPPSAPTIVSQSGGAVTLTFTPPVDTGGVPLSDLSYAIYANNVLVAQISQADLVALTAASSSSRQLTSLNLGIREMKLSETGRRLDSQAGVVVGNLNPSTQYTFQITTISSTGGMSAGSTQQSGSTSLPTKPGAPDPPLLVKSTGGLLSFSWSPVKDDGGTSILNYILQVTNIDTMRVASCEGLIFQCTLSALDSSSNFIANLQAVNVIGASDVSTAISVATTSDSPPSPPTRLVLVDLEPTTAYIEWVAPMDSGGNSLTNYVVELSTGGGTLFDQQVSPPSDPSARISTTINGLTPQTQYSVAVVCSHFCHKH